ncbi:hypothetical protein BDD12DRAFT_804477 [Trichophaea hybrida]|nr:hypothetical protein BDD12DRAFT_804477 [Trichophaea hybrida]
MVNLAFNFNAQLDVGSFLIIAIPALIFDHGRCLKKRSERAEFRFILGLEDSFDTCGSGKCVGWETDDIGEIEGFAGAGVLEGVVPIRWLALVIVVLKPWVEWVMV